MSIERCRNEWRPWAAVFVGAVALLAVYAATLAPTLTWNHDGADGGDLVTAVARGSIPHPPGFPTYLLLGELFIRLPWGDPAWRLNLMSAIMATGAATLTAMTVQHYLPPATCHLPLATCHLPLATCYLPLATCYLPLASCLCVGFAPLFWSQAVITEVYALGAFFVALVMYLALGGGPAWALGLAWGLGIGVHPTLLFLAPLVWEKPSRAVLLTAARSDNKSDLDKSDNKSDLPETVRTRFLACFLALLSCGMLYGPVLLARGGVPSPWGDVNSFEGWWALVSGRMYHGYLFGLPLAAWPRRLMAWAGLLARQFTPLGALLAGLGWTRSWREWRSLAVALALTFGAFNLYAIGYDTADSLVYLVLALPVVALWLGLGLSRAVDWLNRRVSRAGWAILLLPLLQALLFWGQMDLSADRTALEWAGQTMRELPPRAVVLTEQDRHTFTLWYAHYVLGWRADVVVLDVDLWTQESYRAMMQDELGIETIAGDLTPGDAARRAGRPSVEITNDR